MAYFTIYNVIKCSILGIYYKRTKVFSTYDETLPPCILRTKTRNLYSLVVYLYRITLYHISATIYSRTFYTRRMQKQFVAIHIPISLKDSLIEKKGAKSYQEYIEGLMINE